jgi:molybdopterin/thiamine biosynthesis adenylyltransferase/rhodanese-related sulfurtransferase
MDQCNTMSATGNRYARQMVLPEVGLEGQLKLTEAHVLVIGAGGLGVPVLQYLAGAGIGTITIIDPDEVSLSNLHRQTLYGEQYLGASKADIAAQILQKLNSDISINAIHTSLDPSNVKKLCCGVSIVLDCADSFAVSYILSDHCLAQNIPFISASALALSGYVGGFCGGAPSLRALFPDLPAQAGNCATAGVLGPVVGTIGSLQAQMALSQILGLAPSPLGQLVRFDAQTFRFSSFRFDEAPEPENGGLQFIAPSDIQNEDFIIELRGLDEASDAIHPGATRIHVDEYQDNVLVPAHLNQRAVFVCRSGLRAHRAATQLQNQWDGNIVLVAAG